MKRWRVAFLLALVSALPILFAWNRSAALLQDSDTRGILGAIREAHDPLKWFRGDWPIANHFYRPIVSLVFEADNALWRDNAAGYGLTNALLCFLCVLALFWALREIADRPVVATLSTALFALWHVWHPGLLASAAMWAAWATLAVGAWRHRRDWRRYVPAALTLFCLSNELLPIRPLQGRMIDWIPGRTASTMALFCLLAVAAYARYERLRRPPPTPEPITPETRPATRGTEEGGSKGVAWPWAAASVLVVALALGSYEQAVMLPAVLGIVGVAMRVRDQAYSVTTPSHSARGESALKDDGRVPRLQGEPSFGRKQVLIPHLAYWGLLVVYLGLRWALLPHTVSGYQHQQYSSTRTAFWMEMEYVFPALASVWGIGATLDQGIFLLFNTGPGSLYGAVGSFATAAVGYLQARCEPVLLLVGWLGSAVAFAPMAWFKLFEHYHYWPMAMRSAFVVGLGLVAVRLAATAVSPPAFPGRPRPRPAPGSLPHP